MKGFLVIALVLFAFGVCLTQPQPAGADTAKSYKLCPKCKVANSPDARFCYSCGTPFEPGAVSAALPDSAWADSTRCPACGVERIPQAEFCSNCGVSLPAFFHAGAPRKIEAGPKKDLLLAFGCSLLVPGAGQLYNEQPVKGAVFFGCYLTGWYILGQGLKQEMEGRSNSGSGLEAVLTLLIPVSWIGSILDALGTANEINRRRGYSSRSSPSVSLVLVPSPRGARPGIGLRAGF